MTVLQVAAWRSESAVRAGDQVASTALMVAAWRIRSAVLVAPWHRLVIVSVLAGDAARFQGAGRDRVQQFDVGSGDRLVVLGGPDGGVEHPQPLAGGVQLVSFGAGAGAGCRAGQCNPGA